MRLLKYFENFLNQSQDEKAYTKLDAIFDGGTFISIQISESLQLINKDLSNFNQNEIDLIKNLLKKEDKRLTFEFNKNRTNEKRLVFYKSGYTTDEFSLEIYRDDDEYYFVRYSKEEGPRQSFECDYKDGLINLISDIKIGKFDYYYSGKVILVGTKTNLLRDMQERYQTETFGDETYYYDNGYHFATLYKQGKFLELRHDGSLDQNGRRKK